MAKKYQELRNKMSSEARARVDARVKQAMEEMPLSELRRARELTQSTLASAMGINQAPQLRSRWGGTEHRSWRAVVVGAGPWD